MNMKNSTWWVLIVVLLIIIFGMGWLLIVAPAPTDTGVNSTSTTSGTDTNPGGTGSTTGALHDRVVVDAPQSGQTVFQNFTVTGKAPGNWYFEASFPIMVVDAQGNVLGSGIATALSDWMTTEDVPFKAELKLSGNYGGPANLILQKDNPSGLPENDDSVSIPITIQAQ